MASRGAVPGQLNLWRPGQKAWFEYHCQETADSADAELWLRTHQVVTIVEEVLDADGSTTNRPKSTPRQRGDDGTPRVYRVRFSDGLIGTAVEDELLTNKRFFDRPGPPLPACGAVPIKRVP